jgi:hypothetical protein
LAALVGRRPRTPKLRAVLLQLIEHRGWRPAELFAQSERWQHEVRVLDHGL